MGKIYFIMGKSSSGKDTLYKHLAEQCPELKTVIPYTTRPIRQGETDGVEYFFITEEIVKRFEQEGRIIEQRAYDTVHGIWKYLTVEDGQICLEEGDYLMIGTLESYKKIREYYGSEAVVPLYIEVEDGLRLQRALAREQQQVNPKYEELCRRFLADQEDFREECLEELGIQKRYENTDLNECLNKIKGVIYYGKF